MAGLKNTLHVSEFSPNGKLYAYIDSEEKLKIWDTETSELKQEFVPSLVLNVSCSALTWVRVNSEIKTPKKRKSLNNDVSNVALYVVLGTNKGGVAIYSYSTGKIAGTLKGNGHGGSVTGISSDGSDSMYTCGEDCTVIEWSMSKGAQISSWNIGNEKPMSIIYLPISKRLVIASRQIKLWNIEEKTLLQTFTGHTSNVVLLKTFVWDNQEYILSASQMDRVLSLWIVKEEKKYRNVYATFLMGDIAYFMSPKVSDDTLTIVSATRSGVTHMYVDDLNEMISKKPIKPKLTIEIVSNNATNVTPIQTITSTLDFQSNKANDILIGYGNRNIIKFEYIKPNFDEKNLVLIRNDPSKFKVSEHKKTNLYTETPIINDEIVAYVTPVSANKKTRTIEVPMETRLENLSLGMSGSNADNIPGKNMTQLLIQGLHSGDANILKVVFSRNDEKTIRSTLEKLPPQYVGSLVNELSILLTKKTLLAKQGVAWLKILLQTHSSQLMALGNQELLAKFGPCIGMLEYRVEQLNQLARTRGRLELLVNQIRRNTDDDNFNNENLLVYEDNNSSSDEIENENNDTTSDDQWEESDEDDIKDEDDEQITSLNKSKTNKKQQQQMEVDNTDEDDDDDEDIVSD